LKNLFSTSIVLTQLKTSLHSLILTGRFFGKLRIGAEEDDPSISEVRGRYARVGRKKYFWGLGEMKSVGSE
jgi:hypothetical protein